MLVLGTCDTYTAADH